AARRGRANARTAMALVDHMNVSQDRLSISDVDVARGGRVLVSHLNLRAGSGELVALRGPSGSGKTTILRAIAGLDPFERGTIEIGDARLEGGRSPDPA